MIRVVVVDDHPVVRAGMRLVLDAADNIVVVEEGASGADALRLVAQHRPDVLVLDVNLPDLNGLEVTQRLRDRGTTTAILILTVQDDKPTIFGLLEAGASGYVLKDEALETLVSAVHATARGTVGSARLWLARWCIEPSRARLPLENGPRCPSPLMSLSSGGPPRPSSPSSGTTKDRNPPSSIR
jgi:DNA-binding NarL/FixJ family response regulator